MHLLFLDESGQLSERRFFALGGVVLRDRDWHALRDLWQATLAEHAWPPDREVKWHGIRTGEVPVGCQKFGPRPEKAVICRQDANFGTPHGASAASGAAQALQKRAPSGFS